jgi:glutamate---cysteine ligase / carboxylate-amine ligase
MTAAHPLGPAWANLDATVAPRSGFVRLAGGMTVAPTDGGGVMSSANRDGRRRADPLRLEQSVAWEESAPVALDELIERFDRARPLTIGVEEEMMLADPITFDLAPRIDVALASVAGDPRFSKELRAAQIEIITPVCCCAAEACRELAEARRDLQRSLGGGLRLLAAGTHPFATSWGAITQAQRYRQIADEYLWAATRSLVCGLHIHVAVGGAERTLAVYNALRSYLPEIAALTTNSPYYEGEDTGMSSIRPKFNEFYPRSGIPPAFHTWEELVRFVQWGRTGGLFPDPSHFWWELRPHVTHGTVEVRVADTQTRVEDAAAVAALVHALVAWLADRADGGDPLPVHETHWIAENGWRAYRYGVGGWLVDLDSGRPEPTRERIARLIEAVEPYAAHFDSAEQLAEARTLLAGNGSDRQRYVYEREGVDGLARWLVAETERSAYD